MNIKIKAFVIHLFISASLFLACYGIIRYIWYPDFFFFTEGGVEGIQLIAAIDFIIGPILTLIVYKPGKKGLKLDLSIIGTLQVCCLAFGMYIVNYEKPLAIIIAKGIASSVNLQRLSLNGLTAEAINSIEGPYPKLIFANYQVSFDDTIKGQITNLRPLSESLELLQPNIKSIDAEIDAHKSILSPDLSILTAYREKHDIAHTFLLPYYSKRGLIYLTVQKQPKMKLGYLPAAPIMR